METKQTLKEFKEFKESKDYNTKWKRSLAFLDDNKSPELLEFDNDPVWEETNPPVVRKMKEKFGVDDEDFLGFYVYQNRDILRMRKLQVKADELLKEGKKEIFVDSIELSDNKKLVEVTILSKYDTKVLTGRLYKSETESGLFLIVKGKSRCGIRLIMEERYFI